MTTSLVFALAMALPSVDHEPVSWVVEFEGEVGASGEDQVAVKRVEVSAEGALFVWASSSSMSPVLEVVDVDGEVRGQDDGGGTDRTRFVVAKCDGRETLDVRLRAQEVGAVEARWRFAPETAATRAASTHARAVADADEPPADDRAATLWEALERLRSTEGSSGSAQIAGAALQVGRAAHEAREWMLVLEALAMAHAFDRAYVPADHPATLGTLANLVTMAAHLSRWNEVETYATRRLAAYVGAPVEDDSWRLFRYQRARAARRSGRQRLALEFVEEDLALLGAVFPDDHPDLRRIRRVQAQCLLELAREREALGIFQRILEEDLRDHGPDHLETLVTRMNLGLAKKESGDLDGAILDLEAVATAFEDLLPAHDQRRLACGINLAGAWIRQGRFTKSIDLLEPSLDLALTDPAHDVHAVFAIQQSLGLAYFNLGRFEEAAHHQRELLEGRRRILPEGHRDVLEALQALWYTARAGGDPIEARRLGLEMAEALGEPGDAYDPLTHRLHEEVAFAMKRNGQLVPARAIEERILEFCADLPADADPGLRARLNLAKTIGLFGDLEAAAALEENVLAVRSRADPPPPSIWNARYNLALSLRDIGRSDEAVVLLETVLEQDFADRGPRNLAVLRVRRALANTLAGRGELDEAARVLEEVARQRALLPADPGGERWGDRFALAGVLVRAGELERAHEEFSSVLDAWSALLAEDDGNLTAVRGRLALVEARLGRRDAAVALARTVAAGALARLQRRTLTAAPRELEQATRRVDVEAAPVVHLAAGSAEVEPFAELVPVAFRLIEGRRSAARSAARILLAGRGDDVIERARRDVKERSAVVTGATRHSDDGDAVALAVLERDRVQRALIDALVERGLATHATFSTTAADVASRLDDGEAAVAYFTFNSALDDAGRQLAAFLVRKDRDVELLVLGPRDEVAARIVAWRRALGVATSLAPARGAAPPVDALNPDDAGSATSAGELVRAAVLDAVLARLEDERRLLIAADDVVHEIPFSALPLDGDRVVGDEFTIRRRESLRTRFDLRAERPLDEGAGVLVAVGDVDYDAGTSVSGSFGPLPGSASELDAIIDVAPTKRLRALRGAAATPLAFFEMASGGRWVHVATHGWFSPQHGSEVTALSPMSLCGLALAGANAPPDALGQLGGVITAEELTSLDLSGCDLAVLSACESGAGVVRGGQGVNSLQRALHLAGARAVLSSPWRVRDRATRDLMIEFYRLLWQEGLAPDDALWRAKNHLRRARMENGTPAYAKRDWAGWILTS